MCVLKRFYTCEYIMIFFPALLRESDRKSYPIEKWQQFEHPDMWCNIKEVICIPADTCMIHSASQELKDFYESGYRLMFEFLNSIYISLSLFGILLLNKY